MFPNRVMPPQVLPSLQRGVEVCVLWTPLVVVVVVLVVALLACYAILVEKSHPVS